MNESHLWIQLTTIKSVNNYTFATNPPAVPYKMVRDTSLCALSLVCLCSSAHIRCNICIDFETSTCIPIIICHEILETQVGGSGWCKWYIRKFLIASTATWPTRVLKVHSHEDSIEYKTTSRWQFRVPRPDILSESYYYTASASNMWLCGSASYSA